MSSSVFPRTVFLLPLLLASPVLTSSLATLIDGCDPSSDVIVNDPANTGNPDIATLDHFTHDCAPEPTLNILTAPDGFIWTQTPVPYTFTKSNTVTELQTVTATAVPSFYGPANTYEECVVSWAYDSTSRSGGLPTSTRTIGCSLVTKQTSVPSVLPYVDVETVSGIVRTYTTGLQSNAYWAGYYETKAREQATTMGGGRFVTKTSQGGAERREAGVGVGVGALAAVIMGWAAYL